MTAPAYYLDTAVPAYALGGEHRERAAAQHVIRAATAGRVVLHSSVEMVQELVHHRMRRVGPEDAVRQARAVAELCILHPFDAVVLSRALDIVAEQGVRGRDAVHAATALVHGLPELVSPHPDFDDMPGITRVLPTALT